jgi:hypothetical protein
MDRSQRKADLDKADGLEDPPLSWIAEAALERWEHEDVSHSKRRMPREERR